MKHSAELKRCLEQCDIAAIRRLAKHIWPHLPQPKTDGEALMSIHHARTQARNINLRLRAYSHCWLVDRGLPSGLPDELKPKAERMYPRVVSAVGISIGGISEIGQMIAPIIQRSMSDAVLECYADNKMNPEFVKKRMQEARKNTMRRLLGK